MLAETVDDVNSIKYPVMASPKLDGIRCLIVNGKALTRKFKPIPNNHIRTTLEKAFKVWTCWFDGELMIPGATFNETQSAIMAVEGKPTFEYHIFDKASEITGEGFENRYYYLTGWFDRHSYSKTIIAKYCRRVPHHVICSAEELLELEAEYLSEGYEGLMVRSLGGPYKCGRSTKKEGYLLKLKRFADSEAKIIGFEEKMHNNNSKEVNELGLTKRSSKKENLVSSGQLGAFVVKDIVTGVEFSIGTGDGLTQEIRQEVWENQDKYLGKLVKYKYQPSGAKDKPRFPVWLGFRHEDDL